MNNGGGGIFDFLPIARHRDGYEELFGTPTGLDLAKVADLYGLAVHARRPPTGSCRERLLARAWSRYRSTVRATWSCTGRCSQQASAAVRAAVAPRA